MKSVIQNEIFVGINRQKNYGRTACDYLRVKICICI